MRWVVSAVVAAACALAVLPAAAALQLNESVDYLPGATADKSCSWEPSLIAATTGRSNGAVAIGAAGAGAASRLSLRVAGLRLSPGSRKSEYSAVVRADIADASGKLLATRDFEDDRSFGNSEPGCESLRMLGASLGASIAAWTTQLRLIDCREGCEGIHPDQPIALAKEVLVGNDDAINDTVRNDCRYLTSMVATLVKTFNEADPPPRARLEPRAADAVADAGRRLVLRVTNVHALGGGGLTGPKWMDMAGELWDGKTLVGSFESHTESGRGLSTCRSVESLNDSSADLIADWLRSPTLGAQLK